MNCLSDHQQETDLTQSKTKAQYRGYLCGISDARIPGLLCQKFPGLNDPGLT